MGDVTSNFGRGATFVAGEARNRGMIDSLPGSRAGGERAEAVGSYEASEHHRVSGSEPDVGDILVAHLKGQRASMGDRVPSGEQHASPSQPDVGDILVAHLKAQKVEQNAKFGDLEEPAPGQEQRRQTSSSTLDAGDVLVAHLKAQKATSSFADREGNR